MQFHNIPLGRCLVTCSKRAAITEEEVIQQPRVLAPPAVRTMYIKKGEIV